MHGATRWIILLYLPTLSPSFILVSSHASILISIKLMIIAYSLVNRPFGGPSWIMPSQLWVWHVDRVTNRSRTIRDLLTPPESYFHSLTSRYASVFETRGLRIKRAA